MFHYSDNLEGMTNELEILLFDVNSIGSTSQLLEGSPLQMTVYPIWDSCVGFKF